MKHPARTLRALAEDLPEARPFLARRDRQRHDLILAVGRRAFAELGPDTFSIKDFATSVWMSVGAFQKYYCDLESLLADLIRTHLLDLFNAIADIPAAAPDIAAARRAAYLQATRTPLGGLTQSHHILVHARRSLPPDLRTPIEDLHENLGAALAGDHAAAALRLLDSPELSPAEIETTLAALIAAREARHQALLAQPCPHHQAAEPEPIAPPPCAAPTAHDDPTLAVTPPSPPPERSARPPASTHTIAWPTRPPRPPPDNPPLMALVRAFLATADPD